MIALKSIRTMDNIELTPELGPCGWPYRLFHNEDSAFVGGVNVFDLRARARRLGAVIFADRPNERPVPAYIAEVDGKPIRFAVDEVSVGVYLLASNDAEIAVRDVQ